VNAADLLIDLGERGFRLMAKGDGIKVRPASLLTPEDRQAIHANWKDLLRFLGPRPWELPPEPEEPKPVPPPGARLYFGDVSGNPCEPDRADHWTWEGGPTWFKVSDYPIPASEGDGMSTKTGRTAQEEISCVMERISGTA
jgi:hypothetical protein